MSRKSDKKCLYILTFNVITKSFDEKLTYITPYVKKTQKSSLKRFFMRHLHREEGAAQIGSPGALPLLCPRRRPDPRPPRRRRDRLGRVQRRLQAYHEELRAKGVAHGQQPRGGRLGLREQRQVVEPKSYEVSTSSRDSDQWHWLGTEVSWRAAAWWSATTSRSGPLLIHSAIGITTSNPFPDRPAALPSSSPWRPPRSGPNSTLTSPSCTPREGSSSLIFLWSWAGIVWITVACDYHERSALATWLT